MCLVPNPFILIVPYTGCTLKAAPSSSQQAGILDLLERVWCTIFDTIDVRKGGNDVSNGKADHPQS